MTEKITTAAEAESSKVPNPTTEMDQYIPRFQQAFSRPTSHVQSLPSDLKFEASMDRSFAKRLNIVQDRLRALTGNMMEMVQKDEVAVIKDGGKMKSRKGTKEEDEEMFTEFSGQFQDVLDGLLENADTQLDIHIGKRKEAVVPPIAPASNPLATPINKPLPNEILHAKIPKPQRHFVPKIDNSNDLPPWKPTLTEKHHQMVPLDYRSTTPPPELEEDNGIVAAEGEEEGSGARFSTRPPVINPLHPYYFETKHLPYPSTLFATSPPIEPKSFAETAFTYVSTPTQYKDMVNKLKSTHEIAVDLEYHSTRSFTGFLCLMQISTRDEDFVVDLLTLRNELREDKLGGVLVDPAVVKVFHGAQSDILWLQQDFDIYVVGLFDTYHATKVLQYPNHSLASLLTLYCNFAADKRYQVADWRVRPLPEEMLHYARSDTHFLLYIFDQLRNTLIERAGGKQNLMRTVLSRSEETATTLYTRPYYDLENGRGSNGWFKAALKFLPRPTQTASYGQPRSLNWGTGAAGYRTEYIFKGLHAWRDGIARREDESPFYVLPTTNIWALACRPPPSTFALAAMIPHWAPLARAMRDEMFKVVQDAIVEADKRYEEEEAKTLAASAATENSTPMQVDPQDTGAAVVGVQASASQGILSSVSSVLDNLFSAVPSLPQGGVISSMFGNALSKSSPPSSSPQMAATSGLFGKALQNGQAGKVSTGKKLQEQHAEAAKKVLQNMSGSDQAPARALIVSEQATALGAVPGASNAGLASAAKPSASAPSDVTADEEMPLAGNAPAPTKPEQIPYVKPAKKEKDEVVQVSRPRTKKRKAVEVDGTEEGPNSAGPSSAGPSGSGETSPVRGKKKASKAPVKPEDVPAFSYANESTSLDIDDKADASGPKKKKVKKVKKPVVDTSGFKMPPQDPQEKIGGNKARTFKN